MTSLLSMRPQASPNKDLETIDLDQLFDQYLETDLLTPFSDDTTTAEPTSSDDLAHLFELPESKDSDLFGTKLSNWDAELQAWHQATQRLEDQNPASFSSPVLNGTSSSFLTVVYPESRGKASSSDPELFSFDDLFELDTLELRAISQPSTPKSHFARPAKKSRSSPDPSIHRNRIHKIQNSDKKSTLSSFAGKMLEPSHLHTGFQDIWTRKVDSVPEHFNIALPPNGLQSPPPSTKLLQSESADGFLSRNHSQPYTIAMSPPLANDDPHNNYQLTPLSSPVLDTNSSGNQTGNSFQLSHDAMASAYISHNLSGGPATLSALHTRHQSHGPSISAWGADTSPSLDFDSFSASPDFGTSSGNGKAGGWWSGAPVSQPSTPINNGYQTAHSRSASLGMAFTTASEAGLGISCDTASFPDFGGELGTSNGASSYDMPSYTALFPPTTSGIPIGTTPANPRSSSRSPSPSPQPHFTRRRHSAHPSQSQHINTTSRTSHRRKSSNSSTQSRAASQSTGGGGFVNFTPSDSKKILTGVAPSGSSKTKARREKEAADKRRKLSQAAFRAVVEAGGDLGRLEKEILVLES